MKEVYLIQDDSLDWYLIPMDQVRKFRELQEQMCSDNQNVFDRACVSFDERFSDYKIESMNQHQLFANLN